MLHQAEVFYLQPLPPGGQRGGVCMCVCVRMRACACYAHRHGGCVCVRACVNACECVCLVPALGPRAGAGSLDQPPPHFHRTLAQHSCRRGEAVLGTAGGLGVYEDRRCRNSWRGINLFSATARHKPIRADPRGAWCWRKEHRRADPGRACLLGPASCRQGENPAPGRWPRPSALRPAAPCPLLTPPGHSGQREMWAPTRGLPRVLS